MKKVLQKLNFKVSYRHRQFDFNLLNELKIAKSLNTEMGLNVKINQILWPVNEELLPEYWEDQQEKIFVILSQEPCFKASSVVCWVEDWMYVLKSWIRVKSYLYSIVL